MTTDSEVDHMTAHCGASPMDNTILVTGGTGFVGSNLAFHLAAYGYRVVVLDVNPPPAIMERFWREAGGHVIFEKGSVTDAESVADVGEKHQPAAVVHAAAVTAVGVDAERRNSVGLAEVNLMGTVRLLDLARKQQVRRMLYISSAGLYGVTAPHVRVAEDMPLQVSGLYMISKYASEQLCMRHRELFNLDVVIGRLGQPYGPMERDTGARSVLSPIFQMAQGALRGEALRVPLPNYSCDWTYTLDLAEAVRLLVEAKALRHRIYNLSNGHARQLSAVMRLMEMSVPGACFKWVGGDEPADVDTRSDPRRGPLDISRLRRDVGYEPTYDLERGIKAALPWWRRMMEIGERRVRQES